jgi:hypothetical protein
MAIKKEFKSSPQIGDGDHIVRIVKIESGLSKKGQPMLTLHYERADEAKVKGYYVKTLPYHMKQLDAVKLGAGLDIKATADELIGRSVGISVELGEPNEKGIRFPQILGYGKPEDVEATNDFANPKSKVDGIPL